MAISRVNNGKSREYTEYIVSGDLDKKLQAQVQAKSIINIIQKITLNSPKKTLILRMEHLQLQ